MRSRSRRQSAPREAKHESLHLPARAHAGRSGIRGGGHAGPRFIAGGTNLLDLMKLEIETPPHLIDVNGIGMDRIEPTPDGGLRVGALVRNTDLAADPRVRRDYAVLSRALLAGASPSCATRRPPPATCCSAPAAPTSTIPTSPATSARRAAAARRSAASTATTPSSAPARPASPPIRATWRWRCGCSTRRRDGAPGRQPRVIPIADFHRLPGDTPHIEHVLHAG
jgi:xanthine dehydrogenase YagS FAD-binding subunit